MSHIHNYEEILTKTRLAVGNWRISEEQGVSLTDKLLTRLMLDFILEELGIEVITEDIPGGAWR